MNLVYGIQPTILHLSVQIANLIQSCGTTQTGVMSTCYNQLKNAVRIFTSTGTVRLLIFVKSQLNDVDMKERPASKLLK